MASLNLSTNGPEITKSYQSVINATPASGPAASSPTYAQWAVYSVSTPLANAFQQDSGSKEAVLKVQSTGDGELSDLIDEFSDGKVQFAFAKVKDSNSGLPKHVYICWCGEGVPERTKGYFANYQLAAAKLLHGYHVQITARSDRDLTPENIIQQVAQASGSNYSRTSAPQAATGPPPIASKPAFMPTSSSAGGFNPLGARRAAASKPENVDSDGWGDDAPPVTRTELQTVSSAYKPTKVNLQDLKSQASSSYRAPEPVDRPDVVKGAYQPIGKVDIAAIRRQAQESGSAADDRPTIVKGSYEPVGKVDIAAIRARAQPSPNTISSPPPVSGDEDSAPKSLAERSSAFSQPERLTELPKPKVANRFGATTSSFTGTKAPVPGSFGLESQKSPTNVQVGAGRTFADQGGKTPAQLWAEKKAREGGSAGQSSFSAAKSPTADQSGNQWRSGYTGKSWAPVQITKTGQSAGSVEAQNTGDTAEQQDEEQLSGGVSGLRDRFKDVNISGPHSTPNYNRSVPEPPALDTSTKPNAPRGVPIPGLSQSIPPPPAQPRSPTPPTPEQPESPIRVAVPVSRNVPEVENARDEQISPPPVLPVASIAKQISQHDDDADEHENPQDYDPGRSTAFEAPETDTAATGGGQAQHQTFAAISHHDYERTADDELELREGERIINVQKIDSEWWMGENTRGETGLFPSSYVEIVEEGESHEAHAPAAHHQAHEEEAAATHVPPPLPTHTNEHEEDHSHAQAHAPPPAPGAAAAEPQQDYTATALFDYEAAEGNELTFPEGATITNVRFPDADWWSGEFNGEFGLFPANYVQLNE